MFTYPVGDLYVWSPLAGSQNQGPGDIVRALPEVDVRLVGQRGAAG